MSSLLRSRGKSVEIASLRGRPTRPISLRICRAKPARLLPGRLSGRWGSARERHMPLTIHRKSKTPPSFLNFSSATDEGCRALNLTDDDLHEAVEHAPPAIIVPRSWTFWNLASWNLASGPKCRSPIGTHVREDFPPQGHFFLWAALSAAHWSGYPHQ